MSFSSDIKKELARLNNKKSCCDIAELAGIAAFCGTLISSQGSVSLRLATESLSTAQRTAFLLKSAEFPDAVFKKVPGAAGSELYCATLNDAQALLRTLRFIDREKNTYLFRISQNFFKNECCRKAFVRGAFLGGGTISNPEKVYHFEFVTRHKAISDSFAELLNLFDLEAHKTKRKSSYVLYFSGANQIEDLINITGAHNNLMEFMNIRILKEKRNNINRRRNCEMGNIDKTVNASILQREAIQGLKDAKKFETLPENLKILANLREEYPEASLSELGQMLTPALSRSGVNHRLKKIIEIWGGLK